MSERAYRWRRLEETARRILAELASMGLASWQGAPEILHLPLNYRMELAQVLEEYVASMGPEAEYMGIAILRADLPRTVYRWSELPTAVIEDEELAKIILKLLAARV